ncbi:MAG: GDP-mannose 4,6-dehydratase [Rhodospirillaceae bacterium]|nr:GDP-mannose 4,6-dehydratase [Rhodospirillaceae bacterium]
MKVLITGITGMVGSHLADFILDNHPDVEVYGLIRWRSPLDNIRGRLDEVNLVQGELRDLSSMIEVINQVRPDRIFHLAAQSFVPISYESPGDTFTVNVIGSVNLLDAVRNVGIDPLIHICSSAEVYGQVDESMIPITENTPFNPASPYAVSKVGQDLLGNQYHISYGLKIMRTRMFTHSGPRRGDFFAESAFAKQIAEVEQGVISNPIKVGNLDSIRTYADVRDAVRAYWALLESCTPGEVYNIGGNRTLTIGEMLDILKSFASVPIEHALDPELLRPADVTLQIPENTKFRKESGWVPEYSLEQTLGDLLDYHRARTKLRIK